MSGPLPPWRALVLGGAALALALPLVGLLVARRTALDVPPPLAPATRDEILRRLRAAVSGPSPQGAGAGVPLPEGDLPLPGRGPLVVALLRAGHPLARVEARGGRLAEAVAEAERLLALRLARAEHGREAISEARLLVDLVRARTPLVTLSAFTTAHAVVPGLDGIEATWPGQAVTLTAGELVTERALKATRPYPFDKFFKPERDGLDLRALDEVLRSRAGLGAAAGQRPALARLRAETFVEGADGRAVPLARHLGPPPPVSAASLLDAARAGGRFLVRHQDAQGRFTYEVDLTRDDGSVVGSPEGDYNMARHCGSVYFLAQLYGATKDPALLPSIERGISYLAGAIDPEDCEGRTDEGQRYTCVVDAGKPKTFLGTTALGALALAEHQRVTGDRRHEPLQRAFVEFILRMQRPTGDFHGHYDLAARRPVPQATRVRYAQGEAALALVRFHRQTGDTRALRAAERALDETVAWYRGFFLGRFFVETEHWTCLAAAEAWPALAHARYEDFCGDYARTLRATQLSAASTPSQPDLAGAYATAPFSAPRANPVGTSTEAMISAFELSARHGRPDEAIRRQVLSAAEFLMRQQIDEVDGVWCKAAHPEGAIISSPVDPTVRIDTIQHACSALLRARELVP